MYEAALTEVLRVVLIVLLIYFGFKILIRWLGPLLLQYFLKKIGKKFEEKMGGFPNMNKPPRKEGEISIEKKPKQTPNSSKEVGEYIDYEEID